MTATKRVRLAAPERRAAVLDCALREFSEGSYRGTTTASIARVAGVTEPILYRHFTSKRALFLACLDESWVRVRELWERAVAEEPEPAHWVRAMALAYRDAAGLRNRHLEPVDPGPGGGERGSGDRRLHEPAPGRHPRVRGRRLSPRAGGRRRGRGPRPRGRRRGSSSRSASFVPRTIASAARSTSTSRESARRARPGSPGRAHRPRSPADHAFRCPRGRSVPRNGDDPERRLCGPAAPPGHSSPRIPHLYLASRMRCEPTRL